MTNLNISIDMVVAAVDQVGFYEMRKLVHHSGGVLIFADTYSIDVFQKSVSKLFTQKGPDDEEPVPSLDGFVLSCEMKAITSWEDLKVAGMLGPGSSAEMCKITGKNVIGESEIGGAPTNRWKSGQLDRSQTYAIYLEPAKNNDDRTPR